MVIVFKFSTHLLTNVNDYASFCLSQVRSIHIRHYTSSFPIWDSLWTELLN